MNNPTVQQKYEHLLGLQELLQLKSLHPEARACCQKVLDGLMDETCYRPRLMGYDIPWSAIAPSLSWIK